MKAAVRCNALNLKKLIQQELHGKRLDRPSQRRRVRQAKPLVLDAKNGGLDLRDRLAAHIGGAKQNAAALKDGANVALHFIIRYPPEVLGDDGPTPFAILDREQRKARMMRQAINFINETHGGNAVFAARLDRDEQGETIVDVFAAPRYAKETRKGSADWVSLTKFGKDLAVKHQEEVARRSPDQAKVGKGKPITSPRAIGMSLQSEFAAFFERENGVALSARTHKERPGSDRLGIDEWKAARAAMEAEEALARQRAEIITDDAKTIAGVIEANARNHAAAIQDEAEAEASRVQIRIQASERRQMRKEAEAEKLRSSLADTLTAINALGERLRGLYDGLRGILPDIRRTIWARDSSPQQVANAKGARKSTIPKLAHVRAGITRSRTEAEALASLVQNTPDTAAVRGRDDTDDRFEM